MASLTGPENASVVFRGQLSLAGLRELLQKPEGLLEGRLAAGEGVTSVPRYRLLAGHGRRVPLLRINASHGCLFRCSFCGDAWSRRLLLVERAALEAEVAELEATFPDVHLVYVGDKTFGQSPQAVENLIAVFRCRPRYRFIVQTHFLLVDDGLIEAMHRLGVVVVELGLESADPSLLHAVRKSTHGPGHALSVVRRLQAEGFHVVLNVLGGLPQEKAESHALTVRFLEETASYVWLFNLYNFVPYPLTPAFPLLRERIFDWRFEHWREDGPPVFRPYHLCPEESWDLFLEKVATAHNIITRHESASPPAEAVGWSG